MHAYERDLHLILRRSGAPKIESARETGTPSQMCESDLEIIPGAPVIRATDTAVHFFDLQLIMP